MQSPARLLLVADRDRGASMEANLRRCGLTTEVTRVDTPGRFQSAVKDQKWDAILHQWDLRQLSLHVSLALLLDRGLETPVVVVGTHDQVAELTSWQADVRVTACTIELIGSAARRATREVRLRLALEEREALRRESEERYLSLIDRVRDILYVHDSTGNFTVINSSAERITGYPRSEILGRNFAEFIAPEYLEITRRGRVDGRVDTPVVYEIEILAKDGTRIPVEVSSWLVARHGIAQEVQGIARDLRDRAS
jgi:PAS domain S-box-containing protein